MPLNFVIPSFAEGILQIRRKGKKKGLCGIATLQNFFRSDTLTEGTNQIKPVSEVPGGGAGLSSLNPLNGIIC